MYSRIIKQNLFCVALFIQFLLLLICCGLIVEINCDSARHQLYFQDTSYFNGHSQNAHAGNQAPKHHDLMVARPNSHQNSSGRQKHIDSPHKKLSIRPSKVSSIISHTIEEISKDLINPVAIICTFTLALTLFVFEYYAYVKNVQRTEREAKSKKVEEIHINFSPEEEEEEESEEKKEKSLGVATGVVGVIAQAINLAAGKTFVTVEALRVASVLRHLATRLRRNGIGSVASFGAINNTTTTNSNLNLNLNETINGINIDTSKLTQAEQEQLLNVLEQLEKNATSLSNDLNPFNNNKSSNGIIYNNLIPTNPIQLANLGSILNLRKPKQTIL